MKNCKKVGVIILIWLICCNHLLAATTHTLQQSYRKNKWRSSSARQTDSLILVKFYKNTAGDNWTDHTNWLSLSPLQTWYGITMNADGRVIGIELPDNNLHGAILCNSIDQLRALKKLNLDDNKGIKHWTILDNTLNQLIYLSLNNDSLDDFTIPDHALINLQELHLEDNYLPRFVVSNNKLNHLKILDLSSNPLSSLIIDAQALPHLIVLILMSTNIQSFSIPAHALNKLEYLDLSFSKSISHFTVSANTLQSLKKLDLSHCPVLSDLVISPKTLLNLQMLDISNLDSLKMLLLPAHTLNRLVNLFVRNTMLDTFIIGYNSLLHVKKVFGATEMIKQKLSAQVKQKIYYDQ
ncbi:MAG: hypothetical protein QM528_05980 [Phycisphaerales bacterium]|nr:hypothetical protein [Phycisphaerales bacterium]